jgi:hypothetical protein
MHVRLVTRHDILLDTFSISTNLDRMKLHIVRIQVTQLQGREFNKLSFGEGFLGWS